jgi:hypothetical protein
MSMTTHRAKLQQRQAAARALSNARGFWAPYLTPLEAIQATVRALVGKGHTPLTHGPAIECYRCGMSGMVYGDPDHGTRVSGGLEGLPECPRRERF